jgi:NTP pyrophosphatase (non-canonical NTP hydrolase)
MTNKSYYIYHIPGQKIGMTCNLYKRVHKQQGYKPGEYEIIFKTDDVNKASKMELELQEAYGYKKDRQSYINLIKPKTMRINPTEQTSTFPIPLEKLKGNLHDNIGLEWETSLGTFKITKKTIPWILSNAKESMYNVRRSYIYNKAFYEAFLNEEHTPPPAKNNIFELIRDWADERGIYDKGDAKTQLIKLYEESGELSQALLKEDREGIIDAIGDSVVVLTNLAYLVGTDIENCIQSAYDEISNRTGEMKNGTFVKTTL